MNSRTVVLAMTLLMTGIALVGCQSQSVSEGPDGRPISLDILRHYGGNDAGLTDPVVLLINSREDLDEIGCQELQQHDIDFENESLVLLALGEKPTGGYWTWIGGVQRHGDAIYVQGVANRPAVGEEVLQTVTYPCHAVVIDKVRVSQVRSEIESTTGQPLMAEVLDTPEPKMPEAGDDMMDHAEEAAEEVMEEAKDAMDDMDEEAAEEVMEDAGEAAAEEAAEIKVEME